jgi:nucleotide-binding universal stress UspA family protein
MSGICVGVDGSPEARKALEWAHEEAVLRGMTVTAVMAWEPDLHAGAITRLPPHDAASVAAGVLDAETRPFAASDVPVVGELVNGKAADVLSARSADAELLVLGTGGHAQRTGLVTHHCITHSSCTVVVVR